MNAPQTIPAHRATCPACDGDCRLHQAREQSSAFHRCSCCDNEGTIEGYECNSDVVTAEVARDIHDEAIADDAMCPVDDCPWCLTIDAEIMNNAAGAAGDHMQMTLGQVVDSFEQIAAERTGDLAALKAQIAELLQRAGDVSVAAEDEEAKAGVIESLSWVLREIDSGSVRA